MRERLRSTLGVPRLVVRLLRARPRVGLVVALVLALTAGSAVAASAVAGRAAARSGAPGVPTALAGSGVDPAAAGQPAGASASPSASHAASRAEQRVPRVRPLGALHEADFLVTFPARVTRQQLLAVAGLAGVSTVEQVDVGRATVAGHPASVVGVDPSSFRAYTPKLTAESDPLWLSVARGELTASFDMGQNARLPLGGTVHVRGARPMNLRIGAFATMLPGIDAVVSRTDARGLGIPALNGIVVSSPKADPVPLRDRLAALVPKGGSVQPLRRVVVIRDAGEFLNRAQINAILQAAASRLGVPYVWGATGPNAFDCSGLVGWAFAHAGVAMPRTSQQQWFAGPHVPLQDARPGDLLFWNYDPADPTDIDHVAIYVGDGKMIVAPHTGDVVRVAYVPTAHLAGVVRVDPAMAAQVGGPRWGG